MLGIGRATAHQYAESGARAIYICDFQDNYLEAHKRELNTLFPAVEIHTRQFDAAKEAEVKAVVDDAIDRYGRLDVFFANAGVVGKPIIFDRISEDEFMSVLKTNTLRYVARLGHERHTTPMRLHVLGELRQLTGDDELVSS